LISSVILQLWMQYFLPGQMC